MIHVIAFSMIFVNIPSHANQGETYDPPMHLDKPNKGVASYCMINLLDLEMEPLK